MQQQAGEFWLSSAEHATVMRVIEDSGLWWEEDEPPSRLSPLMVERGWSIEIATNIAPFVGVATQSGGIKRLMLRDGAPLSIQAATMGHTLAHDVLGHHYDVDLIATIGVRTRCVNRGVHPAYDMKAGAAAAMMLIPERFVYGGFSVRDIVSWCGVPTTVVMRRLTETVIVEDDPPSIIRIDRRDTERHWQSRESVPLKIGGVTE